MSLKIIILVTLLASQFVLKSILCLDEESNVLPRENSNLRLRDSLPCIVGTRYRTRRCKQGRKRGFMKKQQQVFVTTYKLKLPAAKIMFRRSMPMYQYGKTCANIFTL